MSDKPVAIHLADELRRCRNSKRGYAQIDYGGCEDIETELRRLAAVEQRYKTLLDEQLKELAKEQIIGGDHAE